MDMIARGMAQQVSKQQLDITNQKGAVNGIATLGADGKVPSTQLPASGGGVTTATINWDSVDELNSQARNKQCIITFVSDDGKVEDYTFAKPIFNAQGVPLCVAPSSSHVGVAGYLTLDQLIELQNNGWEIMSHTVTHIDLSTLNATNIENELKNSKDWFVNHGLDVQNIMYPYGGYNYTVQQLTKKYYRGARTIETGHNDFPLATYEMTGWWFSTTQAGTIDSSGNAINTLPYYQKLIDEAVANKTYLIISFHSADAQAGGFGDVISQVIAYAKTKAPVLSMKDALDRIGNIVDIGVYSKKNNYSNYCAIGCNGVVAGDGINVVNPSSQRYIASNFSVPNDASTTIFFDGNKNRYKMDYDSPTNGLKCAVAGMYLITAMFRFATNGTGFRLGKLCVNGTSILNAYATPTAVIDCSISLTAMLSLNVGDIVTVQGYQNSGAVLNIVGGSNGSVFSIVKVS